MFKFTFILIVAALCVVIYKNITLQEKSNKMTNAPTKHTNIGTLSVNKNLHKINKNYKKAKEDTLYNRLSLLNANLGDRVFLRLFKLDAILEVWIKPKGSKKYKLLKVYDICKYSGMLGPKLKEGDYQSPEGFYKVYKSSLNPNSKFHLSFNLGFPNRYDRAHKRSGSYLMIHGKCASIGCYAMGNKNIEDIYELVEQALNKGHKFIDVHIFPFRLSSKNLANYKKHKWHNFWLNLKEGYDIFEKTHNPPAIKVKAKRYIFKKY
jgi:murein L,D-transpeptidase YafK